MIAILCIYVLITVFFAGYKLGNTFGNYPWIQVVLWPIYLLLLAGGIIKIAYQARLSPLVEILMILWFNKKIPAQDKRLNAYYQKCLKGQVRYSKLKIRSLKKLAKQNNIILRNNN